MSALNVITLNVITLNVIILNVIILNVLTIETLSPVPGRLPPSVHPLGLTVVGRAYLVASMGLYVRYHINHYNIA